MTVYGTANIIIAGHVCVRRLCLTSALAAMITRLTVALFVLATTAVAGETQSPAEAEAAKKEQMYQEWIQSVREGIAQV